MLFAVSVAKKEVKKEVREKEFMGLMMFLCLDMVYTFITAEGSYRDNGEEHVGYRNGRKRGIEHL